MKCLGGHLRGAAPVLNLSFHPPPGIRPGPYGETRGATNFQSEVKHELAIHEGQDLRPRI